VSDDNRVIVHQDLLHQEPHNALTLRNIQRFAVSRSRARKLVTATLLPRDNRPCAAFKFRAFCVFVDRAM
jgi:hypothetical protein